MTRRPPTIGHTARGRFAAGSVIALLFVCVPGAAAKSFGGVVPDIPTGGHVPGTTPLARIANLPYGGGPVMHSNRTHVIFWQPRGSGLSYDPGYEQLVETFLRRVARDSHKTTNVYGLSGQYHDGKGPAAYDSSFAGGQLDLNRLPRSGCTEPLGPPEGTGPGWNVCLTDEQLASELRRTTRADHLPVTSKDIYFLVLPNGFGVCEGGGPPGCALGGTDDAGSFCGYHTSDPEGQLLYAVIPYNALSGHCQSGQPRPNGSTADPALSTISHEHNEAMTDPNVFSPAWIDPGTANENGDLCIDMSEFVPPTVGGSGSSRWSQVIAGGRYWLQDEWSNADRGCRPRARPDAASFRAPNHVRTGQALKLTATAHTGRAHVKAYDWFFANRGRGRGRTVMRTFSRPGSYRLVLRVTDTWGNWAYAVHTVTVT